MTTAEQRLAALDAANQIRVDRAKLRLRIAAGEVSAADVLAELPACMAGCGVYQLLTFIPNIGKRRSETGRAFALLHKAGLANVGHKRIDALTEWQMERLTRVVREYEQSRHPAERGLA